MEALTEARGGRSLAAGVTGGCEELQVVMDGGNQWSPNLNHLQE